MGLNLGNIYERPYVMKDGRGGVKRQDDNDTQKSAVQLQQEEQAGGENSKSRGLQYVDEKNVPQYQKIQPDQWQNVYVQKAGVTTNNNSVNPVNTGSSNNLRSSNINIAQILKDFKNTQSAIGTPEDICAEVNDYLSIIEKQVLKDNPNINLIKSNLKNASSILDNYISKTLDKDSKVVENWVDALFLQHINFKYDEGEINPQFLVKFPEGSTEKENNQQEIAQVETIETISTDKPEIVENNENQPSTTIKMPEDKELKSLFIQAKRLAYANEPRKAIENFEKALVRADEVGDKETKSKIYYEVGQIYNGHDYQVQALRSYQKSLENTTDLNIKTKAHYSMAQIYDDVNQIEPALDHYFVSVGFGGESENLTAQTTSLAKMGNIYTDMYEQNALKYFDIAKDLISQTDNSRVKGFVASSEGRAYERFGEPQEALKSYSEAIQHYTKSNSALKVARNYVSAADIMLSNNNNAKARNLLNKAQKFAEQSEDENLLHEINSRFNFC